MDLAFTLRSLCLILSPSGRCNEQCHVSCMDPLLFDWPTTRYFYQFQNIFRKLNILISLTLIISLCNPYFFNSYYFYVIHTWLWALVLIWTSSAGGKTRRFLCKSGHITTRLAFTSSNAQYLNFESKLLSARANFTIWSNVISDCCQPTLALSRRAFGNKSRLNGHLCNTITLVIIKLCHWAVSWTYSYMKFLSAHSKLDR